MKVTAKQTAEAAQFTGSEQSCNEVLALGGDSVHMGECAEHGGELLPHLSLGGDLGNQPIHIDSWLVKRGDAFEVMTAEEFHNTFEV